MQRNSRFFVLAGSLYGIQAMNLADGFLSGKKPGYVVEVDSAGAVEGAYRREQDGSYVRSEDLAAAGSGKNCWLAIPPGSCVVRSLELAGGTQKELVQAVACYAESSLLHPYEDGYVTVRTATTGSPVSAVLFWCEKQFLDDCVANVESTGFSVRGILVPELSIGCVESCLLYYEYPDAAHGLGVLCHGSPQSLPIVQCGPAGASGPDALLGAVLQELRRLGAPDPEKFLVWSKNDRTESPAFEKYQTGVQGAVPLRVIREWTEFLPLTATQKELRSGLAFAACLQRDNKHPLDVRGYWKLLASVAVTLVLVAGFIATLYAQLDDEVARLEKEAAQVSRASQKAGKATQMIRNLQEKNKTIRRFAQDKPYCLELLKIIADATSMESRLEGVSISRDGRIVINGLSKDASHVTAIVKKLEESPQIVQCKLTSLERVAESGEFKFTVQARSEAWTAFFEESAT